MAAKTGNTGGLSCALLSVSFAILPPRKMKCRALSYLSQVSTMPDLGGAKDWVVQLRIVVPRPYSRHRKMDSLLVFQHAALCSECTVKSKRPEPVLNTDNLLTLYWRQ